MSLEHFYCITFSGEGIAVAKKLQDEGVEVCIYQMEDNKDILTKEEKYKPEDPEEKKRRLKLGNGMVEKLGKDEFMARLKKADKKTSFVFTDFNHCFKVAQEAKKYGLPGMYPTEQDRHMEIDRQEAKQFVEKNYDVEIPETHEFKKIDEAVKFLEGTDKAFVLKGFDEDAKTIVPDTDDVEDAKGQVLNALEKEKMLYEKSGFVLEEKIPKPVEITPEALFWNGELLAVTVDLELKRFGAGDTGPMTGCAADIVFPVEQKAVITKLAFPPAVMKMAKEHEGMFVWDASLLFSKGKPYFGEFCANRVGYNCFLTQLEMVGAKAFFEAVMEGENPYENSPSFGASIRLFNVHKEEGKPVSDMPLEGDIWPLDVTGGATADGMATAGYIADIGVVTGSGDTIEGAMKRAAMKAQDVDFREKYYRPLHDLMSTKYPGAIINRYKYGEKEGLW